jgi:predicted  nucleic acid-binding Zn-ribbon protein
MPLPFISNERPLGSSQNSTTPTANIDNALDHSTDEFNPSNLKNEITLIKEQLNSITSTLEHLSAQHQGSTSIDREAMTQIKMLEEKVNELDAKYNWFIQYWHVDSTHRRRASFSLLE